MSKILDKILNVKNISKIFADNKRTGSMLGIDIGSSAIKIIQLSEKEGKAVLENYGELALGPYAGLAVGQATSLIKEKTKEALSDIFREANIEGKHAALSIPMSSTLLSLVELPRVDKKQLNSMMPIEARKYIPVPVSEVVLDWWTLPKQEDKEVTEDSNHDFKNDKIEVLLAAIHNDTINKYKQIQNSLGLASGLFEIDVFSSIRSVVGRNNSVVMVLDMGAGTTKLAVVDFGILRMQHIINMGSQDISITLSKMLHIEISEAEEIKREQGLLSDNGEAIAAMQLPLNHIITEINRFITNYKKKNTQPISKIVLTGGGILLKGLPEFARKNIDVNIEVGDPFSRIETLIFLQDTLKEAGPEFSVAIGLAIKALQE
ncbi:MAG: type IV pilus assembly protein PilM [Candidatus Omnitrophica bacterium]|nr:type IV pilus assembly protein PilM [Candidatus Omnitrophota bacterium]